MAALAVDALTDHDRRRKESPISALSRELLELIFEYVSELRII
jgi:hypothetical protein